MASFNVSILFETPPLFLIGGKFWSWGESVQKNKGFTLIELMVTIAVLVIVAMMAAPNMMQLVYKKQLETEARDLAMTLSNVRGTAVSLRKDISLEFKNQENTGDKFYWDTTRSTVHVLAKGLPEGITFTPTGLAKKRTTAIRKLVNNPGYKADLPEMVPFV